MAACTDHPKTRVLHLTLETPTLTPLTRWRPEVLDWGIVLVADGLACLNDSGTIRMLAAGNVVALPSGSVACFSGGRNRDARLQYFSVSLDLLTGVFSCSERQRMMAIAASKRPVLQRFSAGPSAGEFARISEGGSNPSLARCEMLRLFAFVLADQNVETATFAQGSQTARERVAHLLDRRPESILVSHTVGELARLCSCSQRHFSRLFHECSGTCVRKRQIEIRLEHAGQLLRESTAKIIQVAMESGYRHLGLFNTMFKKRFGKTPGEWRRENSIADRERNALRIAGRQTDQ